MLRRALLLTIPTLALIRPARAAAPTPFTANAFAAAQAAGKPILVTVHADWCPTCAKQKPIVERLLQTPEFKDLVNLVVNFDTQKDICKSLGVTNQSTLIAWSGKTERERSVGVTSEAAIIALMRKTLTA